ncbi:hypothetical protein Lfu02_55350 [Longispora fulva]|uniref:Uncharacterized protein n=1 Tax=Longispora fulva TaxID=619741 RepID=A0A8J7GJ59_9ACTN|nr:hypothetical protein [Longispora fulva]MBG6137483.1 hypothetical protein [Longispora fulva]GIG61163.1 hypothetical protein Lfu02_55350 [Longispora fulva]
MRTIALLALAGIVVVILGRGTHAWLGLWRTYAKTGLILAGLLLAALVRLGAIPLH